ncbi:V-type ATPase, G subunit [Puccinia sorghi]|uniref:V-type proton ATPase subunit G n=1 Tax=Puccinia sorghi TaxID=27349 RepID=A0A0L6UER8_9BASI|nr:V-type ATPase, G subunit [Puccinia sorghi]
MVSQVRKYPSCHYTIEYSDTRISTVSVCPTIARPCWMRRRRRPESWKKPGNASVPFCQKILNDCPLAHINPHLRFGFIFFLPVDRSLKLKEARGEAAKEIDSLKSKREEEFKEFEQQHSGNTDSQQKALEEETKKQIEVIKAEFNKNKTKVVSDLLAKVTDVKPELHQNYKLGIHQLK